MTRLRDFSHVVKTYILYIQINEGDIILVKCVYALLQLSYGTLCEQPQVLNTTFEIGITSTLIRQTGNFFFQSSRLNNMMHFIKPVSNVLALAEIHLNNDACYSFCENVSVVHKYMEREVA